MSGKTLAEVLEGYAVETSGGNDLAVLRRWIEENPEFADDLMEFAAARAIVAQPDEEFTEDEEARFRELGRSVLANAMTKAQEAPQSLAAAAAEKGWDKAEFAKRLGISISLLMYAEKRRLQFSSIPKVMIERIAGLLEMTEQTVANYLQMPAATGGTSFKTATRPDSVSQKSFADAVREDQTLTTAEKRALLDLT